MERYPLEALLSVRHYREEGAKRRVRGAENALREAEAEMEKKKKELEAFRIWRVEEEDRRYAAIMGVPMRMEKLDAFKNGLALLVAQENDKEQAVVLAGKEVERRKEELLHAQEAVKTALQGGEKLDFALLMPFRGEDAGGVNAVITADAGEIPYLIQYDTRWAYHAYGSSVMGITACGPTCLSMAAIGLTGDAGLTPARIADWAEDAGYYVDGAGTAWSLFTDGAAQLGLRSEAIAADEDGMKSRLDAGEVLIASMLPGDFTTSGHFVVIVDHGLFGFNVYDPNSISLSSRAWSFDKLEPQIAQLWSFSAAPAGESLAGTTWYADCEEFITLRAEPNTGAAALTTIPRGGEMTYVSPAGEFTCVEYQGQRGYVLTSYIARSGGAPAVNPAPETAPPAESGGGLIDTAKEWLEKLM